MFLCWWDTECYVTHKWGNISGSLGLWTRPEPCSDCDWIYQIFWDLQRLPAVFVGLQKGLLQRYFYKNWKFFLNNPGGFLNNFCRPQKVSRMWLQNISSCIWEFRFGWLGSSEEDLLHLPPMTTCPWFKSTGSRDHLIPLLLLQHSGGKIKALFHVSHTVCSNLEM